MRFVAGDVTFTDNVKQLLPDISIFDKLIMNEPTILENRLWRKKIGLNSSGISSGSVGTTTDNVFYRSCYLLYKKGAPIQESNISLEVTNVNFGEIIP